MPLQILAKNVLKTVHHVKVLPSALNVMIRCMRINRACAKNVIYLARLVAMDKTVIQSVKTVSG